MKDIQITSSEPQVDEIMDIIFQEGPAKILVAKAHSSLQISLTEAKESAILYGSLDHPTIITLYMAIRKYKVIAIDFGVDENDFIVQVEKQFDAPVYFGPDETEMALEQVQNYLDGQLTNFDLITDISILTDFQQQVLQATQQIPRGRIATYMDIARKIGKPKAVRAVGQALGRNPIPIVIPCHRVVASNGSLGGYSGGGGLETKAKLLKLEGAMAI